MTIPARLGIVTLGVADLARSIAFYEALGWERCRPRRATRSPGSGTADTHIGLFPWRRARRRTRDLPAEPRAPFGGITLAINVETRRGVAPCLDAAVAAGGTLLKPATVDGLGRDLGLLRRPGRPPLGDRPQPALPDRRRRPRPHPLTAAQRRRDGSRHAAVSARRDGSVRGRGRPGGEPRRHSGLPVEEDARHADQGPPRHAPTADRPLAGAQARSQRPRDPALRHASLAAHRPAGQGEVDELLAAQRDPGRLDGALRAVQEAPLARRRVRPSTSSTCCSTSMPRSRPRSSTSSPSGSRASAASPSATRVTRPS